MEPQGASATVDAAERAAQVRALLDGQLDPAVDARGLLDLPLDGVVPLRRVAEILSLSPRARRRARRTAGAAIAADPQAALLWAYVDLLSLEPGARQALVAEHQERRQQVERAAMADELAAARRATLEAQLGQLRAYLEGRLDPSVDPAPLLRVDLAADLDAAALERAIAPTDGVAGTGPDPGSAAGPDPDGPHRALAAAQAALDRARLEYTTLPAARRAELARIHDARQAEAKEAQAAQEAARAAAQAAAQTVQVEAAREAEASRREAQEVAMEREAAVEAARAARSRTARLLAEERVRLLDVRERQTAFRAQLAGRLEEVTTRREAALAFHEKAQELEAREARAERVADEAEAAFDRAVEALAATRQAFSAALPELVSRPSVPGGGDDGEGSLPPEVDQSSLDDLRVEVREVASELEASARDVAFRVAEGLRDDMTTINRARLTLLGLVPSGRRERVTGFGAEGIREFFWELQQIQLRIRFNLSSLPRLVSGVRDRIAATPIEMALALVKLLVALVIFRWWRSSGDAILAGARRRILHGPPSTVARFASAGLWYLLRIRGPLEALVLALVVLRLIEDLGMASVEYVRLVLSWLLTGLLIVRFLDAMGARQQLATGRVDETERLRWRSLRLTGLTVVGVGLLLSVTVQSVGRGTIYTWVLRTFWLLVIPVGALLVRWWHDPVHDMMAARSGGDLVAWVRRKRDHRGSHVAAAVGGVMLLVEGVYRFGLRLLSNLEVTQKALAYLFRREVSRRSALKDDRALAPVFDELAATMGPEVAEAPLVESVGAEPLDQVEALLRGRRNTATVVVGERGAGKSTFLRRLGSRFETGTVFQVACPAGGFDGLVRVLAEALAPTATTATALAMALRERAPVAVCIDDAHHLVRPIIGGLADLDRAVEMIRAAGDQTSWVMGFSAPLWRHVSRSRGDRAMFDQVIELPRWSESAVAALVQSRSRAAGLDPSFDDLVVPRQLEQGIELDESERTEKNFYRILWDYAEGNPAVALYFWRCSLFRTERDEVVVRLPDAPSPAALEDLPATAYFVLRAILQLDPATVSEIVDCTMLRWAEVADALRFARARGWLEGEKDAVRISHAWYRAVSTALKRQHLLTK